jgi:hypothetical protein
MWGDMALSGLRAQRGAVERRTLPAGGAGNCSLNHETPAPVVEFRNSRMAALPLRDNPEVSVRSRGWSADDGRCGAISLKPD